MKNEQYTSGHIKPSKEKILGERNTVPNAIEINKVSSATEASKEVCTHYTVNEATRKTRDVDNTPRNDTQKANGKTPETQTRGKNI